MLIHQKHSERLIPILVSLSVLGYLSIRGLTNAITIGLALLGLWVWVRNYQNIKNIVGLKKLVIIVIASGSLLIATSLSQIFRNPFQISSFDGPSRIFIGFFIFILLYQTRKKWLEILSIVLPISLVLLCLNLLFIDQNYISNWGGRYASYFVDPNTLGGQTAILSVLCLSLLFYKFNQPVLYQVNLLIGFMSGFILMFQAQSRGGWLAFAVMLICLSFLQYKSIKKIFQENRNRFTFFIIILITFFFGFLLFNYDQFLSRLNPISAEISLWKDSSQNLGQTAVGARLGMWEVSFLLIQESPLFGFGEKNLRDSILSLSEKIPIYLNEPLAILIGTGPHSDILAKLLANGLFGFVAYMATLGGPAYLFFNSLKHANHKSAQAAANLGLIYISGLFFCGLFNETLSLKYLCSFYAMMVAILLASALSIDPATQNEPQ
jgi:O-antigen ligase